MTCLHQFVTSSFQSTCEVRVPFGFCSSWKNQPHQARPCSLKISLWSTTWSTKIINILLSQQLRTVYVILSTSFPFWALEGNKLFCVVGGLVWVNTDTVVPGLSDSIHRQCQRASGLLLHPTEEYELLNFHSDTFYDWCLFLKYYMPQLVTLRPCLS